MKVESEKLKIIDEKIISNEMKLEAIFCERKKRKWVVWVVGHPWAIFYSDRDAQENSVFGQNFRVRCWFKD